MTTRFVMETTLITPANRTFAEDYRPTEDEPFMNDCQRVYFRGKLLAWRDEILRSTKETRQHLHEETTHTLTLRIVRARRPSAWWNSALAIVSAS